MRFVYHVWMLAVLSAKVVSVLAQSAGPEAWTTLAPMPLARQEISSAALDGKIYVIAGFNNSGASTSDVQVYDPKTNSWSLATPLPIVNNHNAAAVAAGRLFSFGGVSNRVFVYNPGANAWSEVAPMRFDHGNTAAVAVIDNRIYVAGGTGSGMTGNELEVYDPVANSWTTLASMAVPRNHCAGGAINGRFYVAAGRGSANASDALEVYDPITNRWTRLPSMPTGRSGVGAAVVNGELYVFGGEIPRLFGEVEAYSPLQNRWRQLAPMPTPRHGLFAAVINNAIYLPGGAIQQGVGATTANEVYTVNAQYTRVVPIVLDVRTGAAHFTTEMTLMNRGTSPVNSVSSLRSLARGAIGLRNSNRQSGWRRAESDSRRPVLPSRQRARAAGFQLRSPAGRCFGGGVYGRNFGSRHRSSRSNHCRHRASSTTRRSRFGVCSAAFMERLHPGGYHLRLESNGSGSVQPSDL